MILPILGNEGSSTPFWPRQVGPVAASCTGLRLIRRSRGIENPRAQVKRTGQEALWLELAAGVFSTHGVAGSLLPAAAPGVARTCHEREPTRPPEPKTPFQPINQLAARPPPGWTNGAGISPKHNDKASLLSRGSERKNQPMSEVGQLTGSPRKCLTIQGPTYLRMELLTRPRDRALIGLRLQAAGEIVGVGLVDGTLYGLQSVCVRDSSLAQW